MKTVLITGASSGIGKAFAELFAKKNDHIILASRNEEKLSSIAQQLRDNYGILRLQFPLTWHRVPVPSSYTNN
ncbi:SDR family NAD(P)-dependent oxidoreductase [Paenibacillus hexagrammi]|uniref:SDR family NAD(P)-dependent oxidoreductase n=1 Tax=Paenibacillus hexagrammi TaxID=2908839 RepID=A0ABY3SJH7_9BACL|nr:SDR family NAD(P)-dependent oxidoreductase [Paenibacillus sp. YPD9-1]UJF33366.1 SDR family NAD(P)-dependent oxidoreductase [Paenibacillus sp. YPD9-1]